MPVPVSYKTPKYRSNSGSSGSSFDLDTSASMNLLVIGFIITHLFEALYISFAHGEGGPDFAISGGSLQNSRLAPGPASHRSYKPSAESAAPESVVPAPNSLFFVRLTFAVGFWAIAAAMLGLFGNCSRNRAAALASVVPSPSEGAPSGPPQRQAFTEVPDALQF